jgi:hypothetical protein
MRIPVPRVINVIKPLGTTMQKLFAAIVSAVMLLSAPAFAASHAGGKMDDKVDCTKKENADKEVCKKK